MRKNIINQTGSNGLGSILTLETPQISPDRGIVVFDGTTGTKLIGGGIDISPDLIIESPAGVDYAPRDANPGSEYTSWVNTDGQLHIGENPVGAGITGPETSTQQSLATWADTDGGVLAANGIIVDADFLRGCKGLQLIPQVTTPSTTGYTVWVNSTGKLMYGSTEVSAGGNVVGPASSYNNRIATFSGTTGKLLQDSGTSLSPGAMYCEGAVDFSISMNGTKSAYISGSSTSLGNQALFKQNTANTVVGYRCCANVTFTGVDNTCVGYMSGTALLSGSRNLLLGEKSGSKYTSAESDNIMLSNQGVVGDNSTIRIGTAQTRAFVSGVRGVSVTGPQMVVVDANGQLGSQAVPVTPATTLTQISQPWTTAFSVTSTNLTMTLVKTGRVVSLFIPAVTGSLPTPAEVCTIQAVPEAYRGITTSRIYCKVLNNGVSVDGYIDYGQSQIHLKRADGSNFEIGDAGLEAGVTLSWITE